MNDGLIPKRYANALFKSALDKNNAAAVYEEMKVVVASFEANPTLHKVLANPFVARDEKEKLLIAAAGETAESDYRAFVKLVLDNNREEFAHRMALSYLSLFREKNSISQVKITTAAPLGDKEMDRLHSLVKKAFPGRKLEFAEQTNPDLIGGFVLDVDSVRMDASLSNEIEQLRQNLLSSK
jgi:F-type H+-transporting ATPase subunit delta